MQEGVFDELAPLLEVLIIGSVPGSICLRWDQRFHALAAGLINDGIAVVSLIGDQMFRCHSFEQTASLHAIRCGTWRDNRSERHTMRIHGQRYLGIEPPLVRLMS